MSCSHLPLKPGLEGGNVWNVPGVALGVQWALIKQELLSSFQTNTFPALDWGVKGDLVLSPPCLAS